MNGVDLRFCPATREGWRCDKRYDHEGPHLDLARNVEWPRIAPPGDRR